MVNSKKKGHSDAFSYFKQSKHSPFFNIRKTPMISNPFEEDEKFEGRKD